MLYMKGVGARIGERYPGDSAHLGGSKNANSNGPVTGEKIDRDKLSISRYRFEGSSRLTWQREAVDRADMSCSVDNLHIHHGRLSPSRQ